MATLSYHSLAVGHSVATLFLAFLRTVNRVISGFRWRNASFLCDRFTAFWTILREAEAASFHLLMDDKRASIGIANMEASAIEALIDND